MPINLKPYLRVGGAMLAITLTGCAAQTVPDPQKSSLERPVSLPAITFDRTKIVMGQTVYVPVYSHIYHHNSRENAINLSATLSIRNTDLTHSIVILSVRYYDTNGHLLKHYVKNPVELKSLASTDFFIAADDTSGGSGANFIVEWAATKMVNEPAIEAVMISTSSSQGISFISPGKVLKQQGISSNPQKNE